MFLVGAKGGSMKKVQFDWIDAHKAGFVLINATARKIALFPNESGHVCMVAEEDGAQLVTEIDVDEAKQLINMLRHAVEVAEPIHKKNEAEFLTFDAIQKAARAGA